MSMIVSQCDSCLFNYSDSCLKSNKAYPHTNICTTFFKEVTKKTKGDAMSRKKNLPAKTEQTEFFLRSSVDKSKVLYYAYLPKEK